MSQCLSESVSEFPWVTPFTFIEEYLKSPKGKLNFILIVKFVLISFILNSFRNLLSSVVCSWRNNAKLPKCLSTGLVFAPSRVPTPVRVTHHPPAYGCQPASSNGSWRCSIPPPPPFHFFCSPSVWLPDTIPYVATLFLKTLRVYVKIKGVFIPLVKRFKIVCVMRGKCIELN